VYSGRPEKNRQNERNFSLGVGHDRNGWMGLDFILVYFICSCYRLYSMRPERNRQNERNFLLGSDMTGTDGWDWISFWFILSVSVIDFT